MTKNKVMTKSRTNKICSDSSSFLNKNKTNLICVNNKPKLNYFYLKDLINAVSVLYLKKSYYTPWNLQSFIYGCVLGDAYINKYGAITFNQGYKQQGFLMWKFLILQQLGALTQKCYPVKVINSNKKRKQSYISYRFNTKSLFKKERTFFYNSDSKKMLPSNFEEILDPQVLALWCMDDGGQGGNTVDGLVIDVSAFTTHEQFLIQQVLDKKFHLKTSLHYYNKNKNYVKLYFKKKTVHVFKQLIRPYVIPSLEYKLGKII